MSKPLNVAIYSVLLITLYFGSALLVQSCGSKDKTEEVQSGNDKLEDIVDGVSENNFFEDDADVSYSSDNSEDASIQSDETGEVQATEEIDYTSPPVETKPAKTYTTSPARSTGKYAIVAGNYLVESNADAMVIKLNKMGYSAEKVVFDLSQYYTVVAGRYGSRSSANSKSASLKSSGYDNYVITSK